MEQTIEDIKRRLGIHGHAAKVTGKLTNSLNISLGVVIDMLGEPGKKSDSPVGPFIEFQCERLGHKIVVMGHIAMRDGEEWIVNGVAYAAPIKNG